MLENKKKFDIAEKVVMTYVCQFLQKTPAEVFQRANILNMEKEDLVLFPLPEYNGEIYISLGMEVVPADHSTKLPEALVQHPHVLQSIEFLKAAINDVYFEIIQHDIIQDVAREVLEASIHFDFDPVSLTFYPVYLFPNRRRVLIFGSLKSKLESLKEADSEGKVEWDSFNDELKEVYQKRMEELDDTLDNTSFDEAHAKEVEEKVNEELAGKIRIGIIYKELSFDELPKHMQDACRKR
jgi:hypothetical protein